MKLAEKSAPLIDYLYWKLMPVKLSWQISLENYPFTAKLLNLLYPVYDWLRKRFLKKYLRRTKMYPDDTDAAMDDFFNRPHVIGCVNHLSGELEIKEITEIMLRKCAETTMKYEKRMVKKYALLRRVHAQRAWLLRRMPIPLRMLF
jgi:hypothetical protein